MSLYKLPSSAASLDKWNKLGEKEWTTPVRKKDIEEALREALVELYKKELELEALEDQVYELRQCY